MGHISCLFRIKCKSPKQTQEWLSAISTSLVGSDVISKIYPFRFFFSNFCSRFAPHTGNLDPRRWRDWSPRAGNEKVGPWGPAVNGVGFESSNGHAHMRAPLLGGNGGIVTRKAGS